MTQEEKQLLLIDLCGRQPYGVKICVAESYTKYSYTANIIKIYVNKDYIQIRPKDLHIQTAVYIEDIKPYLRSMSSMTFKETREFLSIKNGEGKEYLLTTDKQNWLNEHHFDYRGLIEKGLALEAPEDMYNS